MGVVDDAHAILGPVEDDSYAQLRASIKKHGLKDRAIIVDQHGAILDGRRREQIMRELGREDQLRFERTPCADDKARLEIMAAANQRRDLTADQRKQWAQFLRDHGLTYEEIGRLTGTSKSTAERDAPSSRFPNGKDELERRTDPAGRALPARKSTPAEVAARREAVGRLRVQGYTQQAIADHLSITKSTVSTDLAALGIPNQRFYDDRPVPPTEPKIDVPREPEPDPRDRWRQCVEILDVEGFLSRLKARNTRAAFASIARDAHEAGDEEWLIGAREMLASLIAYLDDMEQAAARMDIADRQHKDSAYRDDIGQPPAFEPRVVGGDR